MLEPIIPSARLSEPQIAQYKSERSYMLGAVQNEESPMEVWSAYKIASRRAARLGQLLYTNVAKTHSSTDQAGTSRPRNIRPKQAEPENAEQEKPEPD